MITECALSNISETPHVIPPLNHDTITSSGDVSEPIIPLDQDGPESQNARGESWVVMKVSVVISLIELCLHTAVARDTSLATVQVLSMIISYAEIKFFLYYIVILTYPGIALIIIYSHNILWPLHVCLGVTFLV